MTSSVKTTTKKLLHSHLDLHEEIMKPKKATKAPRHAGIDPSTMKMKQAMRRRPLERTEHPIRHGNQLKVTKRGLR